MKIVIFAGGTGRRLWPLSRKASPKQFEPIIGDKSTVKLAFDRVHESFGAENILVATNRRYLDLLRRQLPELPVENFIGEPERRDLAAAVGLAMVHAAARFGAQVPVAIIWGDNYMTETETFLDLLSAAEGIVHERKASIVFIGETPRFANDNLGWIGTGDRLGLANGRPYYGFESWIYRPSLERCREMFEAGAFVWNTGYFVTTPGFVLEAYRRFQPRMREQLSQIERSIGSPDYQSTLNRVYPQIAEESFDDAVVQHIELEDAVVLHGEMGWSDPGTLYALKEAVNPDPEANVERGLVRALATRDSLLFNYDEDKLLAVAGLDGMVVVNTPDAIVVVHKDDIKLVKELVNGLAGTELEKYS
jgi:mannose-1-phosphate guanylyltransferase